VGIGLRTVLTRVALVAALIAGTAIAAGAGGFGARAEAISTLTYLYGVSCTSPSACTAVGNSDTAPPVTTSLAERWNGSRWTIQRTPSPRVVLTNLYAVSCASRSSCIGVGAPNDLAEKWNGATWTIQRTPQFTHPAEGAILYGVSCTSSTACTAVGTTGSPSAPFQVSLAMRWNGSTWQVQSTPNRSTPSGGTYLKAVSCASRTACTAVGFVGNEALAEANIPLAMSWNGARWTIQPTPVPSGTNNTNLYGVSCVSAAACMAVGYAAESTGVGTVPLAESWNGSTWAISPVPAPPGEGLETTLYGVSCTSRNACTAVGSYYNPVDSSTQSLAERWNGSAWTIQQTVNPGNVVDLYGVSCASSTACTAVGRSFSGATAGWTSLIEHWNGTTWTRASSPNP
jgi:hypothetical protein